MTKKQIKAYPEHLLDLEKRMMKRGWSLSSMARPIEKQRKTYYVFKNAETGEPITFNSQSAIEEWLKQKS